MKLFTREEKRNKKLVDLYEENIKKGMRPPRAAKEARETLFGRQDREQSGENLAG